MFLIMDDPIFNRSSITFIVVILLLIIGFFYSLEKNAYLSAHHNQLVNLENLKKSERMHVQLAGLFQEHSDLLAVTLRDTYANSSDAKASQDALHQTTQKLSQAIGTLSNKTTQTRFLSVWDKHDHLLLDYVDAVKSNNKQFIEIALQNIYADEDNLSNLLSSSIPTLPKDKTRDYLSQNDILVQGLLNMFIAKQFHYSYSKQAEAREKVKQLADVIVSAKTQ